VKRNATPLQSLTNGTWFKAICGASFQHLPAIRSLTIAYALAGADCIDVAADPAVVAAAREGLTIAAHLKPEAIARGFPDTPAPWLMVSFNDAEDPHFRKAEFDPRHCPADCLRPCEAICPAAAIVLSSPQALPSPDLMPVSPAQGVIEARCYGCGRCVPICPIGAIETRSYVSTPASVAETVLAGVDAIEIHTRPGSFLNFVRLWRSILPQVAKLKLVAVSCPDSREFDVIEYFQAIAAEIAPKLQNPPIWQADGRPMSGDVGKGATMAAIHLGRKLLHAQAQGGLPGFVQLAGGTNDRTVAKLHELKIPLGAGGLAGVAYGSFARRHLSPVLERLEAEAAALSTSLRLEDRPDLLWQAVDLARQLTRSLKPDSLSTLQGKALGTTLGAALEQPRSGAPP